MGLWQRKSSWFTVLHMCIQRHTPGMPRLLSASWEASKVEPPPCLGTAEVAQLQ